MIINSFLKSAAAVSVAEFVDIDHRNCSGSQKTEFRIQNEPRRRINFTEAT